MLRNNDIYTPYFFRCFERQEWVHDWIRPTVQFFEQTKQGYLNNMPIAIMLEMQGGIDGYLLLEQCSISYKTRAPIPLEENPGFWKQIAESSVWITPNLGMRLRLGDRLGLPGKILNGVNLDNLTPANLHEYFIQLAKVTARSSQANINQN